MVQEYSVFGWWECLFRCFFGYREPYFESVRAGYGDTYADILYKITPDWMFFASVLLCVIGGILGGTLGATVLKKHFKKAGMA